MDFALTDDQTAIVDLARRILSDACTPGHLTQVESGPEWFDRTTWAALAQADLLGLTLPASVGGGGYGFLERALLLQEAGRAVAPLPLWATLTAASVIAELGTDAQQQRWLPGVVSGHTFLAVALAEAASPGRLVAPVAVVSGDGWTLSGTCTTVSAAHVAAAIVVPAAGPDGPVLLIVPTDATGVSAERQDTFNHEPQFQVTFDAVALDADALLAPDGGIDGDAALTWLLDRAVVGLCAVAAGVAESGMRLTAAYVSQRQQFERVIGTFQAVGQRMADCYIDAGAMELTMLAAATALDTAAVGHAVSPDLITVAKYWASYGGSRVGHAGLHLHGGISIDLDYPIHRNFLWAKHLEFQLGAGTEQLSRLGSSLAEAPVAP